MITAIVEDRHAFATRGARGVCGDCNEIVIAKCGEVVRHHWAHKPGSLCDWAAAPEGEWHAGWKLSCADASRVEVTRGNHRADAVSPSGLVLEFQHSNISPDDVRGRERHWRRGVWVADGTDASIHGRVGLRVHPDRLDDTYRAFRWSGAPQLLSIAKWPIWVDLDEDHMLIVGKSWQGLGRQGYGWLIPRETFTVGMLNGYGLSPPRPIPDQHWRPEPLTEKPETVASDTPFGGADDHIGPTLDWRGHRVGKPLACVVCERPALMRDVTGRPCHKTCAEEQAAVSTGAA